MNVDVCVSKTTATAAPACGFCLYVKVLVLAAAAAAADCPTINAANRQNVPFV